ncbi:MAG: oxygen-independent coproporphyrinogen III oxidase [Verrucomicrobiota bacterium]
MEIDQELLKKYDQPAPRYTSYPTAPQFTSEFTGKDYLHEVTSVAEAAPEKPLSLYFHLPFCESVCFYCGCNVTFTKDRTKPEDYNDLLYTEMDMVADEKTRARPVHQLHYGGGTPTFFSPEQLNRLFVGIQDRFHFAEDAEIGLEVDPRETTNEHLIELGKSGFNRISMGIQDFDLEVQEAVNRVQSVDETKRVIDVSRDHGMTSVSVDLIYGLPHQSVDKFAKTVETILSLNPDRIALFNFAYLPERIKHQKAIDESALPEPTEKIQILTNAIQSFTEAGYRFIGLDHFAKPDDPLCQAQDAGTLYRNFQGYTTHAECDLLGFGVSSISQIGRAYAQNEKNLPVYKLKIQNEQPATERGLKMNDDDVLRREIIMRIMCDFSLDYRECSERFRVPFTELFSEPLSRLPELESDGLIELSDQGFRVTETGRLLVRNVAMLFDAYVEKANVQYSRSV